MKWKTNCHLEVIVNQLKSKLMGFSLSWILQMFYKISAICPYSSYLTTDITFYEHAPNTVTKRMEIMIYFMRT